MSKRIGPITLDGETADRITLDGETADRITLLNLKEYRSYLKKELAEWRKNPHTEDNPDGVWMHSEDVTDNMRAITALNLIIMHLEGEE